MDVSKVQQQEHKKIYACPFDGCSSAFDRPYRLAQHRLVHVNVKPFTCAEHNCQKAYTSKSHLDRHIKTAHKEAAEVNVLYCCPKCMKKYVNRQNLKRHIKVSHIDNNKPFCCALCRVYFKKKHQLRAHMYIHNGLKPFRCPMCERDFITLYEKKKHMRNHKIYECEHCESKFTRWTELMHHKRVDHVSPEYICHDCGKIFKERGHIIRHVKKHMPNAPVNIFFCPYDKCFRHYSRNSNLKQHILVKHEGLTFDCSLCGAKLSTKVKLIEHIKHHSRTETIVRNYKTLENGRNKRKDAGELKYETAMKLAGIINEKTLEDEPVANPLEYSKYSAKLNEHVDRHNRPELPVKVHKTLETGRKKRKDAGTIRYETAMRLAGVVKQKIEEGISRLYTESIIYQENFENYNSNSNPCIESEDFNERIKNNTVKQPETVLREDVRSDTREALSVEIKVEANSNERAEFQNNVENASYEPPENNSQRVNESSLISSRKDESVGFQGKVNSHKPTSLIEILNRPNIRIDDNKPASTSSHCRDSKYNIEVKIENDNDNVPYKSDSEVNTDMSYSPNKSLDPEQPEGCNQQITEFPIKLENAMRQSNKNENIDYQAKNQDGSLYCHNMPSSATNNALSSLLQLYWKTILNYQDV